MPPKWGHKENITFIYCTVQGSGLFKLWKSVIIRFKNIDRRHDHGCTFQKFFAAELLGDWIVVKGSFLNVRFIEFRVFMWLINEQFFRPTDLKKFKKIFNPWLWQSPNGGVTIVTSLRMINCDNDTSIVMRALCSSSVSQFILVELLSRSFRCILSLFRDVSRTKMQCG